MNTTIQRFAAFYRQSVAARTGMVKDYTLDWEKFLRATGLDDGDARELAEQELVAAERVADGLFTIDRNARTGMKERLRLKCGVGEAWLFAAVGQPSPHDERESLARFFQLAALTPVPCADEWRIWCETQAQFARNGDSVAPFKREDIAGNTILLEALAGVLNWREESLVRYASAVICRNSKALENLRPRLLAALRQITGRENVSLEDFGISEKPRSALIHGPLALEFANGRIDFGLLSGPVSVSAGDLAKANSLDCRARLCLTVENESVFLELAKRNTAALLIQTSFPGAGTRLLLNRLPAGLPCHHFGDSDPAGFDILRDLREKTGREFKPVLMDFRPNSEAPPLTADERKTIERLLALPIMADVRTELEMMLGAESKGAFEQELVPLTDVNRWLRTNSEAAPFKETH